jgi:hypothetical protein
MSNTGRQSREVLLEYREEPSTGEKHSAVQVKAENIMCGMSSISSRRIP